MGLFWRKKTETDSARRDESLPIIRLEHISKVFKGDADEETVALTGRHGRHQSRRIRVDLRTIRAAGSRRSCRFSRCSKRPPRDRYWLNGRRSDFLSPGDRARARSLEIGLIFQSFNLIADMTVYENVEYPLDAARRLAAGTRRARQCRARARGDDGAGKAAARPSVGRASAARRYRARNRGSAADPARR